MTYAPTAADFNRLFRGKTYGSHPIFTARSYAEFVSCHDIDLHRAVTRFEDDVLTGALAYGIRDERAWFGLIGVREERRGSGLGKELFYQAIEDARALGVRTIDLEIVQRNVAATRMVRDRGFEPVAELFVWTRKPSPAALNDTRLRSFAHDEIAEIARPPHACWQREPPSIAGVKDVALVQVPGAYAFVRVRDDYGMILDASATDPDSAGALVQELDLRITHDLTLNNEPSTSTLSAALREAGWRIIERQQLLRRAYA